MDKTCNYNPTLLKTGVWVLCISCVIDCIVAILGISHIYVSDFEIKQQIAVIYSGCISIICIINGLGSILMCCSKVGRIIFWYSVIYGICALISIIGNLLLQIPLFSFIISIAILFINIIALGILCSNVPLRREFLKLLIWGISLLLALYAMATVFNSYYICLTVNESFNFFFSSDINELEAFKLVLAIISNIIWISIFFKFLRPTIASYDAEGISTSSVIFSKYTFTLAGVYLVALCISFIFWNII